MLQENTTGYRCKNETQQINHLYVDDELVRQFSHDIKMEFGLNECAKATFKNEKYQKSQNIGIDKAAFIIVLNHQDVYKYL